MVDYLALDSTSKWIKQESNNEHKKSSKGFEMFFAKNRFNRYTVVKGDRGYLMLATLLGRSHICTD